MRELLVVRHAIAEERAPGMDDALRPLTAEGRNRMVVASRGLQRQHENIDTLLSSPLLRARQTAEILAGNYPHATLQTCAALTPDLGSSKLVRALNQTGGTSLAIVGHEPGLSRLITALICGEEGDGFVLKKGGAALLRFTDQIALGEGSLQWLLTPRQLRLLGRHS
ncbi:MAG: histidine phosphatase family protein [Gammaproteobacteria bacterium]|nr:histidine phosphatase family protein [Gammaproteobacteria bacterium]